jgi:hypothetical protein
MDIESSSPQKSIVIYTPGGSASHYLARHIREAVQKLNERSDAAFTHKPSSILKRDGTALYVFADSLASLISRARRGILQQGWLKALQKSLIDKETKKEVKNFIRERCRIKRNFPKLYKDKTPQSFDFELLRHFLSKTAETKIDYFGMDDHFNSALEIIEQKFISNKQERNCFIVCLKDPLINKKLSAFLQVPINIEYRETSRLSLTQKIRESLFPQTSDENNIIMQEVIKFYADIDKRNMIRTEEFFNKYFHDLYDTRS